MKTIVLVTVVGVVGVLSRFANTKSDNTLDRKRKVASTVRAVGAMIWPTVLFITVPKEDRSNPYLCIPLLWNTIVWVMDSYFIHYVRSSDSINEKLASIRLDHSNLAGLTFGLCSLVGSRPDSKYTHIFMYAILGCLVLVLPSHNLEPGCMEEQLFDNIQKTALMWCIGLIIAAVLLTKTHTESLVNSSKELGTLRTRE